MARNVTRSLMAGAVVTMALWSAGCSSSSAGDGSPKANPDAPKLEAKNPQQVRGVHGTKGSRPPAVPKAQ